MSGEEMTVTEAKRKRSPHQPVGRWIRKEKRLAIYLRDEFKCLACGKDLHGAHPRAITLDHIRPRSKGGSNDRTNLFTCCRTCNSKRQSKTVRQAFGDEVYRRVEKHRRRKLNRYLDLARELIAKGRDSGRRRQPDLNP